MKNIFKSFKREDFFKKIDLHIHSAFSDGQCSFKELLKQAGELGLEYFSITDHNTIEGYKTFADIPQRLITGVEFDCFMDLNLPHILGYNIDINNKDINRLCRPFKDGLLNRLFHSRNPKLVIDAIHNAGGIAVLAHPCCYWCLSLNRFVKKLVKYGLDGIESYYPYNRITRIIKFHSRKTVLKLAEKYRLIKTGGQDCHCSLLED